MCVKINLCGNLLENVTFDCLGLCSTTAGRIFWEDMMHLFAVLNTHMQLVGFHSHSSLSVCAITLFSCPLNNPTYRPFY